MEGKSVFKFKKFDIAQDNCTMKVNTDGVLLGAWSDIRNKTNILDIGTGTGVIAIMLTQRNDMVFVTGLEIEETAFIQAGQNMQYSIFKDRLMAKHASLQQFAEETKNKYDLVVSNPPFFSGGTFSNNENKANVRHTIKLTHSDLLKSVRRILTSEGHFDVILPYIEGLKFAEMAENYDLYLEHATEVRSRPGKNIERLLMRFGRSKRLSVTINSLVIHEDNSSQVYTGDFIQLTKDFYLYM